MAETTVAKSSDLVEGAGLPVGSGEIKPGYDPRLTNEDLAPLRKQSWGSYNIFAFWMSDVHSVGGYVTAGSLFALGLPSWHTVAMTEKIALSARPWWARAPGWTR